MVTIAHIAGNIIERKPFIEEALSRGLINYGALAEEIQPEIEKELKKKIKLSAIVMALRRYQAKGRTFRKVKFDQGSDITTRSDLIEITFGRTSDIEKLYNLVDTTKGDTLSIVVGINEITVITNRKYEKEMVKAIGKKNIRSVYKNLSSLTVHLPENATEMLGLFYLLTKTLTWENISIVEMVSTWTEATYILNTEDIPVAIRAIHKVIEGN